MRIYDFVTTYWPHIVFLAGLTAGTAAAIHAAMTKNEVRAAIGWVGICLMSPLLGPTLYLIMGVNRIRHDRITKQRGRALRNYVGHAEVSDVDVVACSASQFTSLRTVGDRISRYPLVGGNDIELLPGGDEAYPAMLAAIEAAERTIILQSYIFDNDEEGRRFVRALADAQFRGVQIRVLIDGIGSRYSRPPSIHLLRKHGIRCALFMAGRLGLRLPYANLRSHRKILVVDGRIGFTGGMNIREGFASRVAGPDVDHDTHFRVEGPLVRQLTSVFADDWEFTTSESLAKAVWFAGAGGPDTSGVPARCIRSGPDWSIGNTHSMLLGAMAVAQQRIRIQSPYFLPDQVLVGALNTAALRGVEVDIVIPGRNNLRLVNYAMTAQLAQVIRSSCRVWRSRGNFDHSKLLTIDGAWSYVGSSNLDPRSLRLNFELDVEIYDRGMASTIEQRIDDAIARSDAVTLETLARIPFRRRLRNRIIWLASPYL